MPPNRVTEEQPNITDSLPLMGMVVVKRVDTAHCARIITRCAGTRAAAAARRAGGGARCDGLDDGGVARAARRARRRRRGRWRTGSAVADELDGGGGGGGVMGSTGHLARFFWEPCLSAVTRRESNCERSEKRWGSKSCGWLCDHASPPRDVDRVWMLVVPRGAARRKGTSARRASGVVALAPGRHASVDVRMATT